MSHTRSATSGVPTRGRGRSAVWVLLALVGAALVSAGCSGDGGEESTGGEVQAAETTAPGETPPTTEAGDPIMGGKVVFGLAAETDLLIPQSGRWGPSAFNVARALYDPIAVIDEEGRAQPYLVEDITPNDDFTEWTLTVRDGVTFHNGDPLTPQILASHLKSMQLSPLTGFAFDPIDAVVVMAEGAQVELDDGEITEEEFEAVRRQVKVYTNQPWATFPAFMAGAQTSYVPHPDYVDGAVPDPVGTGPFEFVEWVRDDHLTAGRNDSYWREGMPYLDAVEFRPLVDPSSRLASLQAGDINVMHTNASEHLIDVGHDGEAEEGFQVVFDSSAGDEQTVLLDTQSGPTADLEVRRALALATDREALNEGLYDGFFTVADTPYRPESPWHSDPGWPDPDLEEARRLVEEWEAENGDLQVNLVVIASQENLRLAQALDEQWSEVGIEVVLESVDETAFANQMLFGEFDALAVQFFNGSDPDEHYHFWDPVRIGEPGELSLNFPRYTSDTMADALDAARVTDDETVRAGEYAKVWADWAENFPYLFLYHGQWILEANDDVRGLGTFTFPDGSPAGPMQWGAVFLTDVWLADEDAAG